MMRSRQEKEQLVRKFEEIVPFLKTQDNFGWIIPPKCDPVFHIHPIYDDPSKLAFKNMTINVKTGWHSEFIYRDSKGVHREPEGITPVDEREWVCDEYKFPCPHV
jgi:hypothetical protein